MLETRPEEPLPQLAAPGAGLPWLELRIARLQMRWLRARVTPNAAAARIESELAAITAIVDSVDPALCARRVLIPRPRGLEDSSRYWSIYMTLEHMRIVNHTVAQVIAALGRGEEIPGQASTAAVKPSAEAGPESMEDLAKSCRVVARAVAKVPDLRTRARYAHPWFGPMDAAGWHLLPGVHMGLHRAQLIAIRERLLLDKPAARG